MKKVVLSDSEEKVIDRLLASGVGESPEQIIKLSLHLLDEHETKLSALRADARAAMDEIEDGDLITPKSIEDTKAEYRARRKQHLSSQ